MENEYDSRVQQVIEYIKSDPFNYFGIKKNLSHIINLSESRLSHLFKENVGISIKKYLTWHMLKLSIQSHLECDGKMLDSLLDNGFYDQPHFNRVYKSFIGISPSKIYKNRISNE
jgi:AraC-like DNA-binding protein